MAKLVQSKVVKKCTSPAFPPRTTNASFYFLMERRISQHKIFVMRAEDIFYKNYDSSSVTFLCQSPPVCEAIHNKLVQDQSMIATFLHVNIIRQQKIIESLPIKTFCEGGYKYSDHVFKLKLSSDCKAMNNKLVQVGSTIAQISARDCVRLMIIGFYAQGYKQIQQFRAIEINIHCHVRAAKSWWPTGHFDYHVTTLPHTPSKWREHGRHTCATPIAPLLNVYGPSK